MTRFPVLLITALALAGCATFKELKPDPDVSPQERGYIELKDDTKNFELDKDKKYFIKFPAPVADNFALVLVTGVKPALRTYLTATFDDGKGQRVPIADEAAANDSVSVFNVAPMNPTYYWVIDSVMQDVILSMNYRYVPRWRYTFETRYAEYSDILERNREDRGMYESFGPSTNTDEIDTRPELQRLNNRMGSIGAMRDELAKLERVFPPNLAASGDTAYRNYVSLRDRTDEELTFQKSYADVLSFFQKEKETRGDIPAFAQASGALSRHIGKPGRFAGPLSAKIQSTTSRRLAELRPYYENLFRGKTTIAAVAPEPPLNDLTSLAHAVGRDLEPETESLLKFIHRFNVESAAVQGANERLTALRAYFHKNVASSGESFYRDLSSRLAPIKSMIPEPLASRVQGYGNYASAVMMGEEIARVSARVNDLQVLYGGANDVQSQVAARQWPPAEAGLRQMYDERSYRDAGSLGDERELLVRRFENELVTGVRQASQQRVDVFVREHEGTIDNVPALYQDSVFQPVYQLTFSSYGENDLAQKREQIEGYLARMKYYQFPENSIKAIYRELIRNMNDRGVDKARAIVEHGKLYKGDDKQVKAYITECNPSAAKWIVKPREYRKVFALPVTSNARGSNEYIFRIRLQIPTEAQFPVYDINIKLPSEIAEKAGASQWYDEITINKKLIKNEGRFRITSPLPSNNYESLITPVQMDKEGNNILEVKFRYPGFRVFEVSAMAQVPIIRKN